MGQARPLRLFIYARILVTFLLLISTVVLDMQETNAISDQSYRGLVRLMALSFLFSVISHVFIKFTKFNQFIAYLQVIWDLLFVSILLLFTGGINSPYSFLYLLSIMNSAVLLGRREALYTASLCGIFYGTIIDFQYFGLLSSFGLNKFAAIQPGGMQIIYNIFLHLIGFYLTSLITCYLADLARRSEEALRTKSIDFDELERLSASIVANIESGLITITTDGNIRVFNPYAEQLTGRLQSEVYNIPISSVFPEIAAVIGENGAITSGEILCNLSENNCKILGFSSIPFTDKHGNTLGIIINFKDLTSKKKLEEALKRSDRLAALGELSARMAHEIRNPLASMSGSVQLLSEHGSITESDQRLLNIISREADRLNMLITEFLTYAKPVSPRKEIFNLFELVEEIKLLLTSDKRFINISINNNIPLSTTVNADINQLKQIFINLVQNAAESIGDQGQIDINTTINLDDTIITVKDNGAGLTAESAKHLFEPFWTTKGEGTGLGLAIIYRIIEEHGGMINAESVPEGGCLFTVTLPNS